MPSRSSSSRKARDRARQSGRPRPHRAMRSMATPMAFTRRAWSGFTSDGSTAPGAVRAMSRNRAPWGWFRIRRSARRRAPRARRRRRQPEGPTKRNWLPARRADLAGASVRRRRSRGEDKAVLLHVGGEFPDIGLSVRPAEGRLRKGNGTGPVHCPSPGRFQAVPAESQGPRPRGRPFRAHLLLASVWALPLRFNPGHLRLPKVHPPPSGPGNEPCSGTNLA